MVGLDSITKKEVKNVEEQSSSLRVHILCLMNLNDLHFWLSLLVMLFKILMHSYAIT